MSWVDHKRNYEERANLIQENRALLEVCEKEQRDLSNEEKETLNKRYAQIDKLNEQDQLLTRQSELEKTLDKKIGKEPFSETRSAKFDEASETRAHDQALRDYFSYGTSELEPEQRALLRSKSRIGNLDPYMAKHIRALGRGSDPGASLVPQSFYDKLYMKLKFFGGVKEAGAEVIETESGEPLKLPIWDDTGNVGGIGTPGTAVSNPGDPTTSNLLLQAWIIDSGVLLVNVDFLQDQGVDIQAQLPEALGIRVGRKLNQLYTTGAGTTEPQGIITGLGNSINSASNTALAYADIKSLVYSVDYAYLDDAVDPCFMCHQSTVGAMRGLLDSNNRPLWLENNQFGINNEQAYAGKFMGYKVVVNNSVPAIPASDPASDTVSLLFGNFKRYYRIREVKGGQLVRFNEVYMASLQVGFMYYTRADAMVADNNAVWGLKFKHV